MFVSVPLVLVFVGQESVVLVPVVLGSVVLVLLMLALALRFEAWRV